MHVYKFRMLMDDNDDFLRDFEIQASQTFEDFHEVITRCVDLSGNELASFYICDQKWNKLHEITLIDMKEDEPGRDESMEIRDINVMSESSIRDFINEPHQRLLYEYDFLDLKTFYIELMSVYKQKDDDPYPRCSLSRGNVKNNHVHDDIEDFEVDDDNELRTQLLSDFEDMLGDRLDDISGLSGEDNIEDIDKD